MNRLHQYRATITWKGNTGRGTYDYKSYKRDHEITIDGKPIINATSDTAFQGDPTKYTPEDLLVSSLSGCHMLWYLHLCAVNGIIVLNYIDAASGFMQESADGSGQFTEVILHPEVTVSEQSMTDRALHLHGEANKMCFIARSVNFPVHHKPKIIVK
jgi:organic hydroperoxide reductase OsmC/OhrA